MRKMVATPGPELRLGDWVCSTQWYSKDYVESAHFLDKPEVWEVVGWGGGIITIALNKIDGHHDPLRDETGMPLSNKDSVLHYPVSYVWYKLEDEQDVAYDPTQMGDRDDDI